MRNKIEEMKERWREDIEKIIGGEDWVIIMIEKDESIKEIEKVEKSVEKEGIIKMMKKNGWLIKKVKKEGEEREDMRGKEDKMDLEERESEGIERKSKVVEKKIVEELKEIENLFKDERWNLKMILIKDEIDVEEKGIGIEDRNLGDIENMFFEDI